MSLEETVTENSDPPVAISEGIRKPSEEKDQGKRRSRRHRENGFEEWGGYMAAKKLKLNAQFDANRKMESEDQNETETEIFKGVSIYVNGYTKPSAEELKRLMMIHGGRYHYYYSTRKTTHIVATNLPDSKIKKLKNEIVVKPDWVVDSIKAGKLLPHQDYLLYTPEFTHGQHRLKFECSTNSKDFADASSSHNSRNFDPSSESVSFVLNSLHHESSAAESNQSVVCQSNFKNCLTGNSTATSPSKSECPVVAGQPGFLSEFYSHSRLHHISTAGQELKRYVQTMVEKHNSGTFSRREKIKELVKNKSISVLENDNSVMAKSDGSKKNQIIMHLDMDCFFVSVGLRKHPEFRGQPVAVTHSKGKRGGAQEGSDINFEASYYKNKSKEKIDGVTSISPDSSNGEEEVDEEPKNKPKISKYSKEYGSLSEIASCSYEARAAGVKNGMLLGEALRRCPHLKTIPYDFEGYSEVSKKLYDIVASYTLDIEAVSCDELYIDCKEILEETCISPLQFASILRSEIAEETGCTASAGLGPNMLLARLANNVAKPNGQYFVSNNVVSEFIKKQSIKDLPGVGYVTSSKFKCQGVDTCGDLQGWSLGKLQKEFGYKTGYTLYNRCRGKDDRVVELQKERKSVSAEINYGIRFEKEEDIYNFLKELSVEVANRMKNINCKTKSVTLKLMIRHPDAPMQTAKFMGHGVCEHISKSLMLTSATDDPNVIGKECCTLAKSLKIKPEDYRGVGIQLSKLQSTQRETIVRNKIKNFLICTGFEFGTDTIQDASISSAEPANDSLSIVERINSHQTENSMSSEPFVKKGHVGNHQQQCPSLEELDEDVLDAVPSDLQKEMLDAYKSSEKFVSASHSVTSSSSLKINKGVSKKSAPTSNLKKCKLPAKQNTLLECIQSSKCLPKNGTDVLKKKPATLAGASDLNEVKDLIEEWVLSSPDVLEQDINDFKDYILDVVDEDLKNVAHILEHFHGLVSKGNSTWQNTYLTILSYVQQKVLQKLGMMLDVKCDFPT